MAERAHGFSLTDHRRVSNTVRRAEAGDFDSPALPGPRPPARGLVRAMLLDYVGFGSIDRDDDGIPYSEKLSPTVTMGDYVENHCAAVITQVSESPNYRLRCAQKAQTDLRGRTFRLRIIPPDGSFGTVTEPISEYALAEDVESAINATGCPAVAVWGLGRELQHSDGNVHAWPARNWLVIWPDYEWKMTLHVDGSDLPTYLPGETEVAMTCVLSNFDATAFSEDVFFTYPRLQFSLEPGTIVHCLPLPGLGLVAIDVECWRYVDE